MKKSNYTTKGRTGREGSQLKAFGGLATIAGLVWTVAGFALSSGYGALTISMGILLAGAVLFWSGLSVAKNA